MSATRTAKLVSRQHGPQPLQELRAANLFMTASPSVPRLKEGFIVCSHRLKDCSLEFGMSRNGCRFNVPTEDWLAFADGMFQSTEILIQCPAALPSAAEVLSVSEGKKNARNSGGLGLRV